MGVVAPRERERENVHNYEVRWDTRFFFETTNLTIIVGSLHEDLCIFVIFDLIRLRMWMLDRSCREYQNTHFVFHKCFSENRSVYGIMWKIIVVPDRPANDNIIWVENMRFAGWITKLLKHTLIICNMYCFSAATIVTRTRFIVTFYLHRLYGMFVTFIRHRRFSRQLFLIWTYYWCDPMCCRLILTL